MVGVPARPVSGLEGGGDPKQREVRGHLHVLHIAKQFQGWGRWGGGDDPGQHSQGCAVHLQPGREGADLENFNK